MQPDEHLFSLVPQHPAAIQHSTILHPHPAALKASTGSVWTRTREQASTRADQVGSSYYLSSQGRSKAGVSTRTIQRQAHKPTWTDRAMVLRSRQFVELRSLHHICRTEALDPVIKLSGGRDRITNEATVDGTRCTFKGQHPLRRDHAFLFTEKC